MTRTISALGTVLVPVVNKVQYGDQEYIMYSLGTLSKYVKVRGPRVNYVQFGNQEYIR